MEGSAATSLNNLNSIFYEHLLSSLKQSLCDDIALGRWGDVKAGDMFILANEKLTSIIHIVQVGNGFVTYQLRGLEFKGTYCQERELEAINDSQYKNKSGFLCISSCSSIPSFLSFNSAFALRWNSWEIVSTDYVLQTYSISLNPANSFFFTYALRTAAIKYLVITTIHSVLQSPKLPTWLKDRTIVDAINDPETIAVDSHYAFNRATDVDYDSFQGGVTLAKFFGFYSEWIQLCLRKRAVLFPNEEGVQEEGSLTHDSVISRLCFILSLFVRRALAQASSAYQANDVDSFLYSYYTLFRGDVRVMASRDEWILADVDFLSITTFAVRMSLKLQQDDFVDPSTYEDLNALYDAIKDYEDSLVICHEGDANWKRGIIADRASLLSIRKMNTDRDQPDYQILTLSLHYSKFKVVKLNKEGVRGMWAAQQQELIFFGNQNEERGSIQQMRPVLRNLVTQSCDLPVGYPIFISPLTTSVSRRPTQTLIQEKVSKLFQKKVK